MNLISKHNLAYALIPFKRNQDVIKIRPGKDEVKFTVAVVDGWNWIEKIPGHKVGRQVAEFVANKYPELFLTSKEKNWQTRAENTALIIDRQVIKQWPVFASCVGVFLFGLEKYNLIVFIGKAVVLVRNRKKWFKPKQIGDYSDQETDPNFTSDVSHFIGRSELKKFPHFSAKPDVAMVPKERPIFIATDGLEDLFTAKEFNQITHNWHLENPEDFLHRLLEEIQKRKTRQKDDISILIKA